MLSIEGIGCEDCLTTFFRLPTSKDAVMPSANFAVLFVQKRAAFPCTFLCFCLPFLSAPKILYEASKILAKKTFAFLPRFKAKRPALFLYSLCVVWSLPGDCRRITLKARTAANIIAKAIRPLGNTPIHGFYRCRKFSGKEIFSARGTVNVDFPIIADQKFPWRRQRRFLLL